MEQKKKSNKQQRREIIAAVKRREAERRKEMWHVRICWISIFVVGLIPGSVPALIAILNLDNDKVTFTNISLGLITITGSACLAGIIMLHIIWKLFPNISLKNDGSLKDVPLPEYLIPPAGEHSFKRIDDKQIVIVNDGIPVRIMGFFIFFILFIVLVTYVGITPQNVVSEGYSKALILLQLDVAMLLGVIGICLKPWRRVVFDRTTKTITIPARFRFQRKETIPYEQAVVTMSFNSEAKTFSGKGEEQLVIANPSRFLGGITLNMYGGMDAALRFARFIQVYMEEEELPDMPEFEKYRQKDFERRKAEGIPPPLYPSSIPTPKATLERRKEREKYRKD